ncbi:helix-turn-helix domain-containing protein [Zunongwangia pacifica]|uniref:Helix-turn-helix domain-containing protein n=1 Tax=Zunongwangia pacifica TaxID=2911062 RepID=A0A9X2CNH3_9FLAO|nr:helix-turn-helix domain-containing protein [Zunongwangia pacifica]MCL6216932.1 helix-turn-helix domain-containing protein [Zunongwangia pacifica]
MKNIIPRSQLKEEEVPGIRVDRINDAYIKAVIDKISEAHRSDHYICILLKTGKAELLVDFKKVKLRTNELLFLYPDQVKSVISFIDSDGWILFFHRSLIDHQSNLAFEESLYQGSISTLTTTQEKWFFNAFELLYATIKSKEMLSFRRLAVESLLNACIYMVSSIYNSNMQLDMKKYSVRRMDITRTFQKLLLLKYKTVKAPAEYAEMMNISLGYLNDTVKMVTGQNVSNCIQQITIKEAQRLLYHSTLSVKEIAEKVGYDDPQYFSRIFSKITRDSPGSFRKKAHKLIYLPT